eukprot:SAG11_NODE_34794_length_270_cov_0.602339_1_plen_57_part_01
MGRWGWGEPAVKLGEEDEGVGADALGHREEAVINQLGDEWRLERPRHAELAHHVCCS